MKPDQGESYWQPNRDDPSLSEQSQVLPQLEDESGSEADDFDQPLSWQASEYVHHEKQVLWYIALAGIAAALFAISVFLINSWTFAILVVFLAVIVGVMARRPPKVVSYALSPEGIRVDDKSFGYDDFRAFGISKDGQLHSIVLLPNKRFMLAVNVYFPVEMGEEIVDIFGAILPMVHAEPDLVDKLAQRIRF